MILAFSGQYIQVVLGQGAERTEPGAERQHHVGLADQLHGRLRSLVAEGTAPLGMAGGEGIVVEVAVHHRAAEPLGQRHALGDRVAHHHAAAADDDRELGGGQQVGGQIEAVLATGAAVEPHRLGDLDVDVTVEAVPGDVDLGRPHLRHRPVEGPGGDLGHPVLVVDVALILDELLEHRELVRLLEPAEADTHGAGLRRDDDHRGVGPERSGDGGHAVRDPRSVLADDHAVATRDPGVAVRHMGRTLLVNDGNEADTGRSEDVHGVHEGGTHDAEGVRHTVGDEGFHERFTGGHTCH